jgi:hypothetical protein
MLKGPGLGEVTLQDDGWHLAFHGTTAQSVCTITTRCSGAPGDDGEVDLMGIDLPDALGTLTGKAANLKGPVTVKGALGAMTLDDVDGAAFTFSATGAAPTALTFDQVVTLTVEGPGLSIKSLSATQWVDPSVSSRVCLLAIGALNVKGDMIGVTVDLLREPDKTLKAAGTLTIGGWLDSSTITSIGHIGAVTVGGLRDSTVQAGDAPDVLGNRAKISSFTVKGVPWQIASVINSNLTAWAFGPVVLKDVKTDNSANAGADFGLRAHAVSSYTRLVGKVAVKKTSALAGSQIIEQVDDLLVTLV